MILLRVIVQKKEGGAFRDLGLRKVKYVPQLGETVVIDGKTMYSVWDVVHRITTDSLDIEIQLYLREK